MRAAVSVARAELRAGWPFVALGGAVGVAAALGIGRAQGGGELGEAETVIGGFTMLCGLVLGAAALGRPIGDGRLGFYLRRPIGAGALWLGKVGGAALVLVLAVAASVAPVWAWSPAVRGSTPEWGAPLLLVTVGCFGIGTGGGITIATKSRWRLLDALTLPGLIGGLALVMRGLQRAEMRQAVLPDSGVSWRAALVVLAAAGIGWLGGSAIALRGGRSAGDAVRKRLSLSWWPLPAIAIALFIGRANWLLHPDAPLDGVMVATSPDGRWAVLRAHGVGRNRAEFRWLYRVADGALVFADATIGVDFSDDGHGARWQANDGSDSAYELDLDHPERGPHQAPLATWPEPARRLESDWHSPDEVWIRDGLSRRQLAFPPHYSWHPQSNDAEGLRGVIATQGLQSVVDLERGAVIAEVRGVGPLMFLGGGRLIGLGESHLGSVSEARAIVVARDGAIGNLSIPAWLTHGDVGPLLPSGELAIAVDDKVVALDLETGSVRTLSIGAKPLAGWRSRSGSCVASQLLIARRGQVSALAPDGTERAVLP